MKKQDPIRDIILLIFASIFYMILFSSANNSTKIENQTSNSIQTKGESK